MISAAGRRAGLATRGPELVDGLGAERVCAALDSPDLVLRPLEEGDREQLFQWANDPGIRAASFSPEPVTWSTHVSWVASRLRDPRPPSFVALATDDRPIGQVRFELAGDATAEISVSLGAEDRGRGLGARLIRAGVDELYRVSDAKRVVALIRTDNASSIRAFEAAGFALGERTMVKGQPALRYLLLPEL